MTTEFIEIRRRALAVYLNKVVGSCNMLKSTSERPIKEHAIDNQQLLETLLLGIRLREAAAFWDCQQLRLCQEMWLLGGKVENIHMQAAHPVLYQSKDLQNFLEASEDEWAMDMARANHESSGGNPAQKTLNSTLAKLKLFGQQTVAGGKHADEEEDPEYLKVLAAMLVRERHRPAYGPFSSISDIIGDACNRPITLSSS